MKNLSKSKVHRTIKCRFCDWQIRSVDEKGCLTVDGYLQLKAHIALHHSEEYEKIIEKLEEIKT
uniref:Uncharacterized protein n=1 Tax=viral metagenome TaxID=1070528 RepID=A0A6M3L8U8_9ZZZZ